MNNKKLLLASLGFIFFLNSCAKNSTTNSATQTTQPVATETTSPTQTTQPVATETTSPTQTTQPVAESSATPQDSETKANTEPEPVKFDEAKSAKWTDTAKLLAGIKLEDSSKLVAVTKTPTWVNHANSFNNAWSKLETQQLSQVRKWKETELKSINESSFSLFYPFSGPDFLYAYSFFPKANEFVLVGLEPVGTIPDFENLSEAEKNLKLQEIQGSLYALLQFSFFRTNDMKVDMAQQGVLPILFVFLARTNNKILDVEYVGIDKDANLQKLDKDKGMIPGVRISFMPEGETTPRTLYYFSTDLSDEGLAKTPQFSKFVEGKLDTPVTYLKAASYLMHYDYFSSIRNLILAQSSHVLQDDSGMPVVHFDRNKWDLKFYGTYTQPIALFNNMYQADLRKIYQTEKNIGKLNFGIGYKFGINESNLMLATLQNK